MRKKKREGFRILGPYHQSSPSWAIDTEKKVDRLVDRLVSDTGVPCFSLYSYATFLVLVSCPPSNPTPPRNLTGAIVLQVGTLSGFSFPFPPLSPSLLSLSSWHRYLSKWWIDHSPTPARAVGIRWPIITAKPNKTVVRRNKAIANQPTYPLLSFPSSPFGRWFASSPFFPSCFLLLLRRFVFAESIADSARGSSSSSMSMPWITHLSVFAFGSTQSNTKKKEKVSCLVCL